MGKGEALQFRRYDTGDPLPTSAFGLEEPPATAEAVDPDVVLTPLLAFDRQRYRLGYGGGYYDRSLTGLRQRQEVTAIGVGFACQEVPEVPRGAHDAQLDKVVTEIQVL